MNSLQSYKDQALADFHKGPGKFEGEPLWSVTCYYMMLDGMQDEEWYRSEDAISSVWKVDGEWTELFPDLVEGNYLLGYEDDQGFWYTSQLTPDLYQAAAGASASLCLQQEGKEPA